jgi:methylisocitrate lyase
MIRTRNGIPPALSGHQLTMRGVFEMLSSETKSIRELLHTQGITTIPGAADALTARLVERAGFPTVYLTGAGYANAAFGLPDVGLISLREVADQVERMANAVNIPLVVDADTGYGNALNVRRTISLLERSGANAIQLEDQVNPKRCGHFAGKEVVEAGEMLQRIAAAVDSRSSNELVLIARTDSIATHGFEEAIRRANLYLEAGADCIFVEAPTSMEQLERLPREVHGPLLINMTEGGKTPMLSAAELEQLGYRFALFPNTALRLAMKAVADGLAALKRDGTSKNILGDLISWDERQEIVGLPEWTELEKRYAEVGA